VRKQLNGIGFVVGCAVVLSLLGAKSQKDDKSDRGASSNASIRLQQRTADAFAKQLKDASPTSRPSDAEDQDAKPTTKPASHVDDDDVLPRPAREKRAEKSKKPASAKSKRADKESAAPTSQPAEDDTKDEDATPARRRKR
jgi:hypothetical protein